MQPMEVAHDLAERDTVNGTNRGVDLSGVDSRDLVRVLKRPPERGGAAAMPESEVFRAWVELRRRGDGSADAIFVQALKGLHRKRAHGVADLSVQDADPDEHRLLEDAFLGELWKAYKRCIAQCRPGPASQLLRDIEAQLGAS